MKTIVFAAAVLAAGPVAAFDNWTNEPKPWRGEKAAWTQGKLQEWMIDFASMRGVYCSSDYANNGCDDAFRDFTFEFLTCGVKYDEAPDVLACYDAVSQMFFDQYPLHED